MACQQRQISTSKKKKLSGRMKSKGKGKQKMKYLSSEVANLLLQLDDELSTE